MTSIGGNALLQASSRNQLERSTWYAGFLLTFLATGDETNSRFALIETRGRKGVSLDPPWHVHRREEESFYVIDGRLTVYIADETIQLAAGEFVTLPRDVPHRYTVDSDDARYLNLCTPAGFEGFLRALSEPAQALTLPPAPDEPRDVGHLIATATEFGIEILLPDASASTAPSSG